MSEYTVKLPDVGEGVAEAEIVEWHVAIGEKVEEDDAIVDVMSDKATIELPSPVAGIVRWLAGEVGDVIAVGASLVQIEVDDGASASSTSVAASSTSGAASSTSVATSSSSAAAGSNGAAVPSVADGGPEDAAFSPPSELKPVIAKPPEAAEAVSPATSTESRATASPAVRARARDMGVELGALEGTGPDGRVTHGDLDAFLMSMRSGAQTRPATPTGDDTVEESKVIGLRRNIAERMQASKRRIPHFTYVEEVDVTELERLRRELNDARREQQPKLSVLPFLMRAVVLAVRAHPGINARFDDERGVIRRHRAVHLGIAVQTDRGLMVPVVKHAGDLDVWTSAGEVARLSAAARTAKITLDELTGSTITITSLGALGGIVSTPVINAPEVAIVGVNKIVDRPVYVGDSLVRRQIMNLSSSFDHRVVDGADAAAFIQSVRRVLETPALLFVA
jgi:2-oxoisovalerate dehydrogenase E2 component (dihydrolipoyl transacylase)